MRAVATAAEVVAIGRHPTGSFQTGLDVLLSQFPVGLHDGIAVLVAFSTSSIQCGGTTVDEMDEAVGSTALGLPASDALYSLRTPVGADVREHDALVGQQMSEEH